MLAILIKHLDHKNVLKNPTMQIDIVNIATSLAKHSDAHPSVAIIGALSDTMRHLRKSIHCSLDDANLGVEVVQWNQKNQASIDACLVELSKKVIILSFVLPRAVVRPKFPFKPVTKDSLPTSWGTRKHPFKGPINITFPHYC